MNSIPINIPDSYYTNTYETAHKCSSFPCYYCNKDAFFNNNSFSCIDKKISFITNSFEDKYSQSNDCNTLSTSVDSETQTSLTFIDIEKYENMSVSNDNTKIENLPVHDNLSNSQTEPIPDIFEMEKSQDSVNEDETIHTNYNSSHDHNTNNYTNNPDFYNSKYDTYYDPTTFNGDITKLPDKVFLDVGEALHMAQSMEF